MSFSICRWRAWSNIAAMVCFACIATFFLTRQAVAAAPLEIEIEPIAPIQSANTPLQLKVRLKNASAADQKVVSVFQPAPAFFEVQIVDRVIDAPVLVRAGPVSIDFDGPPPTTVLKPQREMSVTLDLQSFLGRGLRRGFYEVTVVYVNKYGKDTVKGPIKSNTIRLRVLDRDE